MFNRFFRSDSGATAIEYAIMAGGIALAVVAAVYLVGDEVSLMFEELPALVIR
ncbi:MAG: Flp family type IVb pilin [Pseudomonadota bacterium]